MGRLLSLAPWALGLFMSAVFLDSLRFKFAGHPTTQHIFETLAEWSHIGLFWPAGPWIIGLGELTASILLVFAPLAFLAIPAMRRFIPLSQSAGALLGVGIMSGAIVFHLFTPLGVETPVEWANGQPTAWSPALFITACFTLLSGLVILVLRGRDARRALTAEDARPATA